MLFRPCWLWSLRSNVRLHRTPRLQAWPLIPKVGMTPPCLLRCLVCEDPKGYGSRPTWALLCLPWRSGSPPIYLRASLSPSSWFLTRLPHCSHKCPLLVIGQLFSVGRPVPKSLSEAKLKQWAKHSWYDLPESRQRMGRWLTEAKCRPLLVTLCSDPLHQQKSTPNSKAGASVRSLAPSTERQHVRAKHLWFSL